MSFNSIYKIILIGDSGVGKTNILSRFSDDQFRIENISTIGVELSSRIVDIDNARIKMQLWDTAGQERYRAITSSYYRGAAGILVVYDVTNPHSFNNITNWIKEIKQYALETAKIILIGNKIDLKLQRSVNRELAQMMADQIEIPYFETSALSGENIDQAFDFLIRKIHYNAQLDKDIPSDMIIPITINNQIKKPLCEC